MLNWKRSLIAGWLLVIGWRCGGCGGPAVTPSTAPWPPTMPVAITPAPGTSGGSWTLALGAVTTLDGTLQAGQTGYILAGFTEGLSPPSPTSSSRQVVFALTCDDPAERSPGWWLEPDPAQVAGCGESLAWTLSYDANRLRLGLALDAAAGGPQAYRLTATAHNPY